MPKHYFTPVFDFARLEDGRIVFFECGGGLTGSGFSNYDFTHTTSARELLIKQLAGKVRKLFIVNVAENVLREHLLGKDFLSQLPNVVCFESSEKFLHFMKFNPKESENALIVIDRFAQKLVPFEEDFREMLSCHGIDIPVVNSGFYRFFDNKVTFPLLFRDDLEKLIPKTYVLNKNNFSAMLKDINASGIKQFICKVPSSSHGMDTLIVSSEELPAIINYLYADKKCGIEELHLSAGNSKFLPVFINKLFDADKTLVIRELVLPKPVKLGEDSYRCAARSLSVAVYDDVTHEVTLDHIVTYWRPAEKPVHEQEAITHENLISKAIEITQNANNRGIYRLTMDQLSEIRKRFVHNIDLSSEDWADICPKLELAIKSVIKTVAAYSMTDLIAYVSDKNVSAVMKEYALTRLMTMPLRCNSHNFEKLHKLLGNQFSLLLIQIGFDLIAFNHFPTKRILQLHLYPRFNERMINPSIVDHEKLQIILDNYYNLSKENRNLYKLCIKDVSVILLKLLTIVDGKLINSEEAALNEHVAALQAYGKQNYSEALENWKKALVHYTKYEKSAPEHVSCLSNLSSCCRDMGNYQDAIEYCRQGILLAKQLNLFKQLGKLATKYEELESLLADAKSTRRLGF